MILECTFCDHYFTEDQMVHSENELDYYGNVMGDEIDYCPHCKRSFGRDDLNECDEGDLVEFLNTTMDELTEAQKQIKLMERV